MLQIRLSNKAATAESGGGAKLPSGETVTVACPDHLVLAELPVAKSLGSASGVTSVKTVGRRSRRQLGERVHFCVQCDFPIAIYGRLIPCEHAFCLDCARSDSICYLCDERIQKIQTIKMMEGLFICAAPHCLKSFLKKADFEAHVYAIHSDLINPNTLKEANDSEPRKPTTSDSTVQAPTPRPLQDSEDRTHRLQPLQPPMVRPLMHPHPKPLPNPQPMDTRPHGFDGPGPYEYPMNPLLPPNFVVPVNPNMMGPASFGQPMYVGPPEAGPWNVGPNGVAFDPSMMMNQGGGGGMDHGRVGFFQGGLQGGNGNDGRGILAANPPPPPQFVQMAGGFFGGDMGQHGQSQAGYGWQQDKRDGFGNGNGNGNLNGQD